MPKAQKELMFRFWNETKKKWEWGYELWGWVKVSSDSEIYSFNYWDKGDEIHIDQYLNIEDKNKTPVYEWDYIKFYGWSIIYLIYWSEEDKKHRYKPISEDSCIRFDLENLTPSIFEVVGNIHEGLNESEYDLIKNRLHEPINEFYRFLDS